MAQYDAGAATARYILDISNAEQSAARLKQIFATIRQDAKTAGGSDADQVKLAQALARRASAEARLAAEANKRLQIDQRAGQQAAQQALAEQRRQTELARTAKAENQAAQSALRLQQARDRASARQTAGGAALPRTFAGFPDASGFLQFAGGVAGGLGLATGVQGAVSGAVDAGRAALDLQRTQALTRALAGTQQTYNQIVGEARKQQEFYGGSLSDNIQKLSGLTIVSRSSGASLQSLIDISQRLAVLDPAQGLEGAQIALREALSGDTRSLALRFEIPRSALVKLKDETIPVAERLLVIDEYLNKIGITSSVVSGTISDQAKAYNNLNKELDDLRTNLGQELADAFEAPARGLTRLIGLINDNPQAIAELKVILGGRGSVGAGDIEQVAADEAARLARQRERRAAAETRFSADRGNERAIRQATAGLLPADAGPAAEQVAAKYAAVRDSVISLAGASDEMFRKVQALADEFAATGDLDRYILQISTLKAQQAALNAEVPPYIQARADAAKADADAATKAEELAQKQAQALAQSAIAKAEGELQAIQLRDLQAAFTAAARGSESIENAAIRLAAQFPITRDEAEKLLSVLRQVNAEGAKASGVSLRQQENQYRVNPFGRREQIQADRETFQKNLELQKAREDQILAVGSAAEKAAVLQSRYNEAVRLYGKNSVEAIRAETDLKQARESGGRARVDQTAATLDRLQNREEDYYIRLLQIQEDYQERSRRSEEDFNLRRSRDTEDYERQRRKLLAEGKRAEAEQLRQTFEREQRRAAEDQAITQRRAAEDAQQQIARQGADLGVDTGRIADRAALRGINVGGGGVGGARTPLDVVPIGAPTAAGPGGIVVRLEFAPIQTIIDGEVVAEATYPAIERRLTEDLTVISVASPVGVNAAGGPRP